MQMIDMLAEQIARETVVGADEHQCLKTVLAITRHGVESVSLRLSQEKWLSLGVHMISMIRRIQQAQSLPPIDQVIAAQLDHEALCLSKQVLAEITRTIGGRADEAEEILLAIHFQAARESDCS